MSSSYIKRSCLLETYSCRILFGYDSYTVVYEGVTDMRSLQPVYCIASMVVSLVRSVAGLRPNFDIRFGSGLNTSITKGFAVVLNLEKKC